MKQSKRILSFLMAIVMMSSFMSVIASAKADYKDAAILASQYDDLDKPVFTLNQCSSMTLDFVDNMLKETNDKDGSLMVELPAIGVLNLTSIDNALDSIVNLVDGSLWVTVKGLMGDLQNLDIAGIRSVRRRSTPAATADTNVVYGLIKFLSDNRAIISQAVDGTLDMGLVNAFFDLSDINVNQIVKKLLYQMVHPNTKLETTDPLYEVTPEPITDSVDQMIQDIIETLIVGTPEEPGFAPGLAGYIDIVNSTKPAYDFVEDLLANVYNVVAVPLLNTEFKKVVREVCGVVYEDEVNFPNGDDSNLNEYAQILNINYVVPVHVFAPGTTLVSELNNIFAEIISAVTIGYTGWVAGSNSLAVTNLANAAKYVLTITGNQFFEEFVAVATPAEIAAMSNQQVFSYILRSVLNGSIDNMNIPASANTLTKVAWYALKEACAQYIPQNDYSAQPQTLSGILFMLADYAVYALNQTIDMNPAAGTLPGQGLLPYGQGLDATITAIMNYVRVNYGGLFNLTLSQTNGWAALDTIVFSIAQTNWLPALVGGSTKELIVNRIIRDILDLNTDNLFALFDHRGDSEFATKTVKKVLIDTVARFFNIIFPGALLTTYTTFDEIVTNVSLQGIIERLFYQLDFRKVNLLGAVLPLLTNVMDLSAPQEYKDPTIELPTQISAATKFKISNDSRGLNTGATNKAGTFNQDSLYKIEIVSLTSSIDSIALDDLAGTIINGGDSVDCNITGTFPENQTLMVTMQYDVYTEEDVKLTDVPLTMIAYSFVSGVLDDGKSYIKFDAQTNNKHTSYYKCLYLNQNASMEDIADMQLQIKRDPTTSGNQLDSTISRTAATVNAALTGVTAAAFTNATTKAEGGLWLFPIFVVDPATAVRPEDGAYSSTFTYKATKTNSTGADETWAYLNKSFIVFYNDLGLPGLLNSEINQRRDPNNYSDPMAWEEYVFAMTNAVSVVYKPRTGSTFMARVENDYPEALTTLQNAVAALELSEVAAGVDTVKDALDAVEPTNTGLEYDDPAYNYFGLADYVPYTYLNYEDERGAAQSLYNSQQLPVEPVLPPDATPDQIAAFNTAHDQWEIDVAKAQADMVALKTVDVAYALHRLNLYAGRLIRVQATKARLNEAITAVGSPVEALYTDITWAAFEKAIAFATSVNAQSTTATDGDGEFVLRQTKVDTAREELIEAYKKLIRVADYTQLLTYIAEAQALTESDWTAETWAVLETALTAALAVPLQMSNLPENQTMIDDAAAALRAAIDGLEEFVQDVVLLPIDPGVVIGLPGYPFFIAGVKTNTGAQGLLGATAGGFVVLENGPNGAGTGALVHLYSGTPGGKAPAELIATYTVVLFGDVNGDATIDSLDAGMVVDHENYLIPWTDPADMCYKLAADANADGSRDSIDAGLIVDSENYVATIVQSR